MKLDKQKLFNAISYLNTLNEPSILDMDFSDLFDDGVDLTKEEKDSYYWGNERLSNIEIIKKIIQEKTLNKK